VPLLLCLHTELHGDVNSSNTTVTVGMETEFTVVPKRADGDKQYGITRGMETV